jgi:hypothetical protein
MLESQYIKISMWSKFEHHIDQLFSNVFLIYFYDTKVIQNLYVTYHKLNAMMCFFIFQFTNNLNISFVFKF